MPGGGRLDYMCVLQGVRTLVHVEGVAYIECARTPASPRYKQFKVHQEGGVTGNTSNKET